MNLLSKVTSETNVIIWSMSDDNILDSDNFKDLNYLFDNGLVHVFNNEIKPDTPYFFQTEQFNESLYMLAFKKQDKKASQLLEGFNNLNLNQDDSKYILVIDSKKSINKEMIKKSVKNLKFAGFNFIS